MSLRIPHISIISIYAQWAKYGGNGVILKDWMSESPKGIRTLKKNCFVSNFLMNLTTVNFEKMFRQYGFEPASFEISVIFQKLPYPNFTSFRPFKSFFNNSNLMYDS